MEEIYINKAPTSKRGLYEGIMVKIKICGNTNEEDALFASIKGADYLGFIIEVKSSADSISRKKAMGLIKRLPLEVESVYVTTETNQKKIVEIAKYVNPACIQLHGSVSIPAVLKIRKELPRAKLIKTIPVHDESAVPEAKKFAPYVDFLLLDSRVKGKAGGTGITHDWSISAKIVKGVDKKVFLAGGLTPQNVKDAIKRVKPYAVDVNSGVKKAPEKRSSRKSRKDQIKIESFIRGAR